jgi:hypothetical protein
MTSESKKPGMTRDELAAFTARANRYFRGETDRELWALALPRIAEMESSDALAGLENYAINWAGPRARFIPAKFFEYVADVRTRRSEIAQRDARVRESDRRRIASSRDAMICEADWASLRREIEVANPLHVGEAIDALRSVGWGSPPAAFSDWPRRWIVAVADVVSGRTCRAYNPDTGNFDRDVPALDFYRMAGKPPSVAVGALGPF